MIQYNKKSVIMVERLCYYYKGGHGQLFTPRSISGRWSRLKQRHKQISCAGDTCATCVVGERGGGVAYLHTLYNTSSCSRPRARGSNWSTAVLTQPPPSFYFPAPRYFASPDGLTVCGCFSLRPVDSFGGCCILPPVVAVAAGLVWSLWQVVPCGGCSELSAGLRRATVS